jgi:hypothetical protein
MKPRVKPGLEADAVYARGEYKYLVNLPRLVKWAKRQINKRFRREGKKEQIDE